MKKIISILLVLTMLCSTVAGLQISAAAANDLPSSGSCGFLVRYSFDAPAGELTITGFVAITNYKEKASPFYNQTGIKTVVIKSSVTGVGSNAFSDCTNLNCVTLPASVKSIGEHAFSACNSLKIVRYTGTQEQWKSIEKQEGNTALETATIYYNYDPNHAHSYNAVTAKPTATALGYSTFTCRLCGDTYKGAYKAPTQKQTIKHAGRNAGAVKVTWNKVKTATGYQVQVSTKDGKKWDTYANVKAGVTTYTFKKLAAGYGYKFRVRFYIKAPDGKNYYSPWSNALTSPTLPPAIALSKLTAQKRGFVAKWVQNKTVSGYQLQYSLKSNFSSAKTTPVKNPKTAKTVAITLTARNLASKKYYYVRVRNYKTIAGKVYYSAWSKVYKVKTK